MGGKSRKTGGVSRALIDRLKAGTTNEKKSCKAKPKEPTKQGLVDLYEPGGNNRRSPSRNDDPPEEED